MAEKRYLSFTGLKEFYYGTLDGSDTAITETAPERIKFLKAISVEAAQEISRDYGDNVLAELAVTNGPTTLTTTFKTVPIEDKAKLFGLETIAGGYAYTPEMRPPYVACAFARTAEDGGTEWLFFLKGMFRMTGVTGSTKTDGAVEFGTDEVVGEFMPRAIDGLERSTEATRIVVYDAPGETTNRDAMFMKVFGVGHPDAAGV